MVSEFAPSTASPLGLPWEQHERCRKSLQAQYLQTFYQHAQQLAQQAAPACCQGQDGGVCRACLSLMSAILAWDFRYLTTCSLFSRQLLDSCQDGQNSHCQRPLHCTARTKLE